MSEVTKCLGPEWTEEDRQAVRYLVHKYQQENPDLKRTSAYTMAEKSYFSLTGRIRKHGYHGYNIGCRGPVCRKAKTDYQRAKKAKKAKEARGSST